MDREQHTAEEIRAEVARLMREHGATRTEVPLPEPMEPDPDGTNWTLWRIEVADGEQRAHVLAVADVMRRWNLHAADDLKG